MTTQEMLRLVQSQLAIDMNCAVGDLNGKKDNLIFTMAKDNPGRRPFPRGEDHFEMLSMGLSIVVSASPNVLRIVKPLLHGKNRDEAFSMPFIVGHGLYYLPDLRHIRALTPPEGFSYGVVEQSDIPRLYRHQGFPNAIQYDAHHPRPDVLVALANEGDRVVGMAGASSDCARMWQVGIDVLPEYRGQGLATYLVNRLTVDILVRGYVPYYGTSSSNIASQRVAYRAGFYPAWVCSYKGRFEGMECLPTG